MPEVVQKMPWTPRFQINHLAREVHLLEPLDYSAYYVSLEAQKRDLLMWDYTSACNAAFAEVMQRADDQNIFPVMNGRHRLGFYQDLNAAKQARHSLPIPILGAARRVDIEGSAAALFGIIQRGANLTAYTKSADGLRVWVKRKNFSEALPGQLETVVAPGRGVLSEETPLGCIVSDVHKEASLDYKLVQEKASSCGVITYMGSAYGGLIVPNILYNFDILLDDTVVPSTGDDEAKEFRLYTIDEVKWALQEKKFTPPCALVMFDFFVRHGIFQPDARLDYAEMVGRLHRKLPFPTKPGWLWH